MTGSELLVHISAPSKVSDDKRYKQQLQGALAFNAVTRHDILTASRPVSPPVIHPRAVPTRDVCLPLAPLDEASIRVRLTDGEEGSKTTSSAITKKKRKGEHQTQQLSRGGKSIASILQNLNRTNTSQALQVERTPITAKSCIQVKRTPAQWSKDKLATNINEHFKRVRKSHYESLDHSWETPPSIIPDSQPSQNTKSPKMSDDSASPSPPRSKKHGAQDGVSSQSFAASQSFEVYVDYPDWQGPTDSQQTASSQAEDSQSGNLQSDELQTVNDGSIEDDYDPPSTGSQSLAGEIYPQRETLEELLCGERAQPQSLPPPATPSSFSSSTLSRRLPPINTMIHHLPRPLPRHKRPKFTTHLTPYLETLTSPTGVYPLFSTFTAKILSYDPSFQQRSIWQRGNWSVPIASWPETAQTTFWENVKARITAGEAGWPGAVNAALKDENDSDEEEVEASEGEEKEEGEGLKVWIGCWAEMKGEIWCLLWEASDGMVGGLSGKAKFWVGGKEVVVMK